jgi:alpha-beta hydrolase superfamily lysophospholipase
MASPDRRPSSTPVAARLPLRTAARTAALGAGAVAGLAGLGTTALAAYFTRRVLTPDHVRPDDVVVHDVDLAAQPPTVTLGRTEETVAPGRYGLWWSGREGVGWRGHARLGEVLRADDDLVVRELLAVDRGELASGPARWNQYYLSGTPKEALGLAYEDVELASDVGAMPAWFVPATPGAASGDWAVLVHGRGATREECLRAVPVAHRLGMDVLVPSYRNDVGAPADPSGRYHLGDSEWRDVEAAMLWAADRGARRVVLMGWSMGGAIVLQAATRSWLSDRVRAVVLDGPVVDWHAVLDHQSAVNRVPARVTRIGHSMMRHPVGRRLVGLQHPLDLRRLDWVTRAAELRLPVLVVHSDADEFVPNAASLALGRARPDVVRVEPWEEGRHTKEWNTDPERWERVVGEFLASALGDAGSAPER